MPRYGRIWEYLRREFDVEARFETIEDKVRLALHDALLAVAAMQHLG